MISKPYLLVVQIPYYVDETGSLCMERLWRIDFERHLEYIEHMVLAAPKRDLAKAPIGEQIEPVIVPEGVKLELVDLSYPNSTLGMLFSVPMLVLRLISAVRRAYLVHSGVVGWPFPMGWLANPIALLMRKPLMIVVESLPWRNAGGNALKDRLYETFARHHINRSSLVFFNQPYFKQTLLKANSAIPAYVYPTVWLSEEDILQEGAAKASWKRKSIRSVKPATEALELSEVAESGGLGDAVACATVMEKTNTPRLKMIYAGRLVPSKGVRLLLEALKILDERGFAADVCIMGEGELWQECSDFRRQLTNIKLEVLKPIEYGKSFFSELEQHHVALLPCIVDEQPRILLDVFAQAVPVIASDIPGLQSYVEHERNGWIVKRDDVQALVDAMAAAILQPEQLCNMGLTALETAQQYSHRGMHEKRRQIIESLLPS